MVCVMVGSSIFKLFASQKKNLYKIPLVLHAVAFVSMGVTAVFFDTKILVYLMFLVFETCVGVFYPAYGVIKSEKIPEEIRSSVMNIFRIPLNAFVVLLLLKIKFLSPQIVFGICTGAHAMSFICYLYFYQTTQKTDYSYDSNLPTGANKDDVELARDPEIQREIQRSMQRSMNKKDQSA